MPVEDQVVQAHAVGIDVAQQRIVRCGAVGIRFRPAPFELKISRLAREIEAVEDAHLFREQIVRIFHRNHIAHRQIGDHLNWTGSCATMPDKVRIETSGSSVYLGPDNTLYMNVIAPNAAVSVGSRLTFHGSIWAKDITVEPDSKVGP